MKLIETHKVELRENCQFALCFNRDQYPIRFYKSIISRWRKALTFWCLPNQPKNLRLLFSTFRGNTWLNTNHIFRLHLEQKGHHPPAIATYNALFKTFAFYLPDQMTCNLKLTAVEHKCTWYVRASKKLSWSTQNQITNAIRFYYKKILGPDQPPYSVDHPRKKKMLPVVLSVDHVERLLGSISNKKHLFIVSLLHGGRNRFDELHKLRKSDIDYDRSLILEK